MSLTQPGSAKSTFLQGAAVVAAALALMWLLLSTHREQPGGRAAGTPMPPIKATGWLNGPAPEPGELQDKVLVIDAWASWCGPCRDQAPEMVHLHEKFRDQGVEFIGLTNQTADELDAMKEFLTATGITWRNGYGAEETLQALEAEYIPMVWVVDRQQRIVWNQQSSVSLEAGIRQALSSK